jgi:ABC-type sugar transport system permease subunit
MTTLSHPPAANTSTTTQKLIRLIAGLVLLAPAALIGLGGLAWPTLTTFLLSLQKQNLVQPPEFIGGENYALLLSDKPFAAALTNTLGLMGARLLVVAIVPVLLALAVRPFGRAIRWPVRLLFSAPVAMFAPAALALVWVGATQPGVGLFSGADWFIRPDKARLAFTLVDSLYVFGLAGAAGLVVYLAAWRTSGGSPAPSKRPLVASWLVSLLAVAALTLQSFTLSYAMTGGGPQGSTTTLGVYQFNLGFKFMQFGAAGAVASLLQAALAGLGLAAGLILVWAGLKLELAPWHETAPARPNGVGAKLFLGVILLISVAVGIAATWPPLSTSLMSFQSGQAYSAFFQKVPLAAVTANTLLPPLALVLLQVPIAYLAALGIGAVRPLGRWSEVLLLPISPWLFVTAGPLSLVAFQSLQKMHALNTLAGLIPPLPLSVPMIFVFTLFFKGQVAHVQRAQSTGQSGVRAVWSHLIWPSLPLVLLLAGVALLCGLQDLYWPLLVANRPAGMPFSVILLWLHGQNANWPLVAAGITLFEAPIFGLFFVIFGALQCLYLDRLILTGTAKANLAVPPHEAQAAVPDRPA